MGDYWMSGNRMLTNNWAHSSGDIQVTMFFQTITFWDRQGLKGWWLLSNKWFEYDTTQSHLLKEKEYNVPNVCD